MIWHIVHGKMCSLRANRVFLEMKITNNSKTNARRQRTYRDVKERKINKKHLKSPKLEMVKDLIEYGLEKLHSKKYIIPG